MKMIEAYEAVQIILDYEKKFNHSLPLFGMDLEAQQPILEEAKKAIAGKRGKVTYEDVPGFDIENDYQGLG